jgi:multiple sugar transport system ATP-binding protein
MAEVILNNLVKIYPEKGESGVTAVNHINLEIKDHEFMVFVGPSGCGKSTTLRMIAGLESITSGSISIGGNQVNDILPKDRDIAMVFQNYALYPHMSVYENMAFGLTMRSMPKKDIEARVKSAAQLLGLENYLDRKPKALSGGQRQRVAVGRAIVRQPKVFLFDEPLSNLDAKMRVSMRMELIKLHQRLSATMIYVTHDQVEAMTMGDRICVMKDGNIMQVDEPLNLYNHPKNLFVAGFIGSPQMNFIKGLLQPSDGAVYFVDESGFRLPLSKTKQSLYQSHLNKAIVLGVRPEDVYEKSEGKVLEEQTEVEVVVERFEPMGSEAFLYVKKDGSPFTVRVLPRKKFELGQQVSIRIDLSRIHLFDSKTENVIE